MANWLTIHMLYCANVKNTRDDYISAMMIEAPFVSNHVSLKPLASHEVSPNNATISVNGLFTQGRGKMRI